MSGAHEFPFPSDDAQSALARELAHVTRLHEERRANPALDAALERIARWQALRLRQTYADLEAQDRYVEAVEFLRDRSLRRSRLCTARRRRCPGRADHGAHAARPGDRDHRPGDGSQCIVAGARPRAARASAPRRRAAHRRRVLQRVSAHGQPAGPRAADRADQGDRFGAGPPCADAVDLRRADHDARTCEYWPGWRCCTISSSAASRRSGG